MTVGMKMLHGNAKYDPISVSTLLVVTLLFAIWNQWQN